MKLNHDCIFYICQYLSPVDRLSVFKADEDLEYIVKTSWNFKTLRVVIGKTLQDCGLIYSVQRLPLKNFQTILKLAEGRTRNLIIYDKTFWNPKSAIIVSFDSHCYVLTNYNSVEEVISLLASRFCRLKQLYLSCNMTRSTFVNSLLKMNTQLEEFTFALECDLTISIDLTLVSKTIHSLSLKFIDLNARQGLDEVFKRLKNLYLEDIVGFDDGLLSEICQYATQLKTLNLQSFDVPVTLRLNSLNKNLPLQNLECFYLSGEGFDLQDRNLIEIAANCPKLRCLELGYCQFSDQALSTALVYLENLEVLYLFSCDRLTQIKLESSLKKMKTLKLLSLSKSVIENISTTMMKTPLLYQLYLDCGDDPVPEFVVRQVIEMSTARMQTFIMRNARMNQELVVYKVGEVDWYEYRADRKPTFCVDSFYMENDLLKNLANFVTNTLPDRKALLFEGSSVVINGVPAVSYTNF